ncbi:MAG: trimeric intracellular cation channel family protein [Clostridia bacterium]|nr:trimeric intracellular cation channel family protein [Clostridia bacterium]
MIDTILRVVEFVGVIAFSISGAIIAIQKKTDIIGALIFALLTSFGGGFIRDITLGITPRILSLDNLSLCIVCLVIAGGCFSLAFVPKTAELITKHSHNFIIELFDAIGLSVFCVLGIDVAIEVSGGANPLVLVFCGCITGVGGGMLRDICSAEIPFILRKHIYLIPTLLGSLFYTFTYKFNHIASMLIAIGIIIVLRVLAILFKWNLPIPKTEGESIKDNIK